MYRTLAKLFTLKPYGNHLIDGMAELWLVLAALNILSIAVCDAIAWGYFGYTTSHGAAAYISAAVAGLIVFTLVGSLDAMFIMHDRSQRRPSVAIAARVVLVVLTFTVTAPFLTQLFFARDIAANIKRHNEQRIAIRRSEIVAQIATRQRDLEKEIAGVGASGRYGRGPTAAAIQREIDALQSEVRTFDQAVPEVLANRYGIDLVREGPATRARVIAELEKSGPFRATQRTIKAFLVFMFLGLVCLKLFQPESVRIYYSARLQAAYAEHPEAGGKNPIRFADWYENDQQVRELTERLKPQEDAVRVLQETLRLDVNRMQEDLATTAKTTDELERQVLVCQHELKVVSAKIAEDQQALDDFRYDLSDDLSLRDQQLLISVRNKTIRYLAEHRAAAAGLTASLSALTHRLEANRSYENQLRESLAGLGTEAATLTTALQKARQRRLGDILSGPERPA
jgi:hypothetical protein